MEFLCTSTQAWAPVGMTVAHTRHRTRSRVNTCRRSSADPVALRDELADVIGRAGTEPSQAPVSSKLSLHTP